MYVFSWIFGKQIHNFKSCFCVLLHKKIIQYVHMAI